MGADGNVITVVIGVSVDRPAAGGAAGGGISDPIALNIVLIVQIGPAGELNAGNRRAAVGIGLHIDVIARNAVAYPCASCNGGHFGGHAAALC